MAIYFFNPRKKFLLAHCSFSNVAGATTRNAVGGDITFGVVNTIYTIVGVTAIFHWVSFIFMHSFLGGVAATVMTTRRSKSNELFHCEFKNKSSGFGAFGVIAMNSVHGCFAWWQGFFSRPQHPQLLELPLFNALSAIGFSVPHLQRHFQ